MVLGVKDAHMTTLPPGLTRHGNSGVLGARKPRGHPYEGEGVLGGDVEDNPAVGSGPPLTVCSLSYCREDENSRKK